MADTDRNSGVSLSQSDHVRSLKKIGSLKVRSIIDLQVLRLIRWKASNLWQQEVGAGSYQEEEDLTCLQRFTRWLQSDQSLGPATVASAECPDVGPAGKVRQLLP